MKEYIISAEDVKTLEEEFNIIISFDKDDELIRCKDCKNNPSTLVGWIECPMTGAGTRQPNDFCSYAKPKVKK